MNRLAPLLIPALVGTTVACSDVVVDVVAATEVIRQRPPEFEYSTDKRDVIELIVKKRDFERYVKGRGSFFLFASNCESYGPGVDIGYSIGEGGLDEKLGGYRLRFTLQSQPDNAYYAQNWSKRLKCVYMKTEADYDPTTYRSNVVRIGTAR